MLARGLRHIYNAARQRNVMYSSSESIRLQANQFYQLPGCCASEYQGAKEQMRAANQRCTLLRVHVPLQSHYGPLICQSFAILSKHAVL